MARKPHPVTALVHAAHPADLSTDHATLAEQLHETIERGQNKNTRRAYRADFEHFTTWCKAQGFPSLPADAFTVATYIDQLARGSADDFGKRKASTIQRRLAAISKRHGLENLSDPTKDPRVQESRRSIRRLIGVRQTPKTALLRDQLDAGIDALPTTVTGIRNRALLRLGFAGAMRRSELIVVKGEHLAFHEHGIVLTIPISKTNQEGELEQVFIPRDEDDRVCPVKAVEHWMAVSGVVFSYLFQGVRHGRLTGKPLTGNDVSRIVKEAVGLSGVDPEMFAGHSLRSGYATSRALEGTPIQEIQGQTRHKSIGMVARYVHAAELLKRAGRKVR